MAQVAFGSQFDYDPISLLIFKLNAIGAHPIDFLDPYPLRLLILVP